MISAALTLSKRAGEILDLGEYERRRDEIRASAMAARNLRRVHLGPDATLCFENRETVRYQIQEMCRAERLARPEQIEHEVETYGELLPSPFELSATLLLEFPDKAERDVRLAELLGLESHLRLEIEGVGSAPAMFDKRQIDVDRLSSVQFARFPLAQEQREAIARGTSTSIVSDHPRYAHRTAIPSETLAALDSDLREAEAG